MAKAAKLSSQSDRPGRNGRARIIGLVVLVLCLGCFNGRDLLGLVRHAAGNEIHSHIILVPFISAYLIYIQWSQLPRLYVTTWAPAVLLGAASVAVLVTGHRMHGGAHSVSYNDYLSFVAFSFLLGIASGGFLFLGARWMKAASFAVAFLLFAIPLPDQVVNFLETASKFGSAEVASAFLNLSGTPVFREGLVFQLPGIAIEVAQECSGIRSSWVLFITSFLAAHMFLKSPWRRAILIVFVIPLGLVRNGFRILVIGLLCVHISPEMIHSVIHKKGGPLFFALSLIPLFFLLRWLRAGEERSFKPSQVA